MNLKQFFSKQGYDISEKLNWDKYITLWESWYRGKVRKFHTYYVYNGQAKVKMEKKSLQGAKTVGEDWADLLFNEKVAINLKTDEDTKQFKQIADKNNLVTTINQGIEKTFALGTGAFVVSVQNIKYDKESNIYDVTEAVPKLEFVECKKIIPLTWEERNITECAFVTLKSIKGQQYVYIAMHVLNESGNYIIKNYIFKGKYSSFIETDKTEKEGFVEEFDTKSNLPWFWILKPNICNNIDSDTPFGISVYANAIDTLKSLDNAYDGLDKEGVLGRRRTFISEEVMTYSDGTQTLTFDPEDISIYRMPKGFDKDSMIQDSSSELRTDKYIAAINFQLNIFSVKMGFGKERYRFDGQSIQTATGVISQNSDMYRRLKKHEIPLEYVVKGIVKSLCYAGTEFGNYNINAEEVKVDFDDSIIEDKGAEQIRASGEVGNGTRSKKSYMRNIRNMTDKEIETELQEIEEEKTNNVQMFGIFPEKESEKDENKEEVKNANTRTMGNNRKASS